MDIVDRVAERSALKWKWAFAGVTPAAFVVSVLLVSLVTVNASAATGSQWLDGDLDAALVTAKKLNKRLFVKFEASWCGPCRRLGGVLQEPAGQAVMKGVLGIRVDFDKETNRKYVEKYVVLGLPTVVVLAADGAQLSRIAGYDDKESWLAEARAAKTASDPLPALETAVRQRPHDPAAVLRLGKALLVRGDNKRGVALLERTGWLAHSKRNDRKSAEIAAETLFVLGRFHHRVRRDPKTAQHIWRELATRYPASGFAGGAWWWYARSQHELGRDDAALAALRARHAREPGNLAALSQWASFVAKYKLVAQTAEINAALVAASAGRSATDLAKLKTLRGKLVALLPAAK